MEVPVGPGVSPRDLPRIVHPPDLSVLGSRVIDLAERARPEHKAMPPVLRIPVVAGDFSVAIDAPGHSFLGTGKVDQRIHSAAQQKAVVVVLAQQIIMTHNVALVIDADWARQLGSG